MVGICGPVFRWRHSLPKYFRVLVLQFSSFLGPERQLSLHIMLFRRACYTGWKNTITNEVKTLKNKMNIIYCQIGNTNTSLIWSIFSTSEMTLFFHPLLIYKSLFYTLLIFLLWFQIDLARLGLNNFQAC